MTTITAAELALILARAQAATEGPWESEDAYQGSSGGLYEGPMPGSTATIGLSDGAVIEVPFPHLPHHEQADLEAMDKDWDGGGFPPSAVLTENEIGEAAGQANANAAFIAAARTDVPALVEALRAAEKREKALTWIVAEALAVTDQDLHDHECPMPIEECWVKQARAIVAAAASTPEAQR